MAISVHDLAACCLVAAVALSACGDNQQPEEANALWQRLNELDYKTEFERAPGYEQTRSSDTSHSDMVDIYINDIVVEALDSGATGPWPEGSLIIKDAFDSDGDFAQVGVMDKRGDGWFWAEYVDMDGDAKYSGKPDICIDCHVSGDDFVRAFRR